MKKMLKYLAALSLVLGLLASCQNPKSPSQNTAKSTDSVTNKSAETQEGIVSKGKIEDVPISVLVLGPKFLATRLNDSAVYYTQKSLDGRINAANKTKQQYQNRVKKTCSTRKKLF